MVPKWVEGCLKRVWKKPEAGLSLTVGFRLGSWLFYRSHVQCWYSVELGHALVCIPMVLGKTVLCQINTKANLSMGKSIRVLYKASIRTCDVHRQIWTWANPNLFMVETIRELNMGNLYVYIGKSINRQICVFQSVKTFYLVASSIALFHLLLKDI